LKKKINIIAKLTKGFFKVSLVIILSVFLLFFLLAGAVQVPAVQNYMVDRITIYAEEMTGYKASIEGIHIDWFDIVVLEEAVLWDKHNAKMIYLGEAEVDYTILSFLKGKLYLDNITLRDGEVNLVRYKDDSAINIAEFIWKIQELTEPKVKRVGPARPVVVPKFTLDNMLFSYDDKRKDFIKDGSFDYYHFTIDSILGTVTNLYAVLDTVKLDAHQLSAGLRKSPLKVQELSTSFHLDKHQIICSELYAKIGESELGNYFRFGYNTIDDLSDFNTKTDLTIKLQESTMLTKDLAHFAPSLNGINDRIFISGNMNGRVNRFSVDKLNATFGKTGHVRGKMTFDGLPYVSETFMNLRLSEINVTANDLIQYTGSSSRDLLNKFGRINGKGEFTGLVNDFAVHGNFNTSMGAIASDINFKLDDKNNNKSKYEGTLSTVNFNLGKFLELDLVQNIDMKGTIKGQGFAYDQAMVDLNATISRIGLHGYDYRNIVTNAKFSERFFDGHIDVKDSNLVLNATGKINMRNYPEEFDIDGKIEKANLVKLNLSEVLTQLSTDFELDFTGTDVDSILGKAELKNTHLISKDKEIFVQQFSLSVNNEDNEKVINLNSDLLSASMKGTFQPTELMNDVPTLYQEYKLFYDQDQKQITEHYSVKQKTSRREYYNEFNFKLKNINGLLDLYYPGVYIAQNTMVKGDFSSGKITKFDMSSSIDSLFYKGNELYKNTIRLSLSKLSDSSSVTATSNITSQQQNFSNSFKTEKFFFDGNWNGKLIDFSTAVAQKENSNNVSLKGNVTINEKYKRLTLKNSNINILEENWIVSDSSNVDFNKEDLVFNYLKIYNKKQSIMLLGDFSSDKGKEASFIVDNFKLKNLNPVIDYKLGGVLDGMVKVRNIYKDLDLNGSMTVRRFSIDDFNFGDIEGSADWMENEQQLNVKIDVLREGFKAINISGNVKPSTNEHKEEISLLANFNSADLGIITPILKGVMSDISGTVNGSLRIGGSLDNLSLKGEAVVENGKFKVDYLGSVYTFNDRIYFTEDQIKFKNITLNDINGNKATVHGNITHDGFKNFLVDIKGYYKNFNVLNTTERDNSLFYGTANVTGKFGLFGSFEDIEIRADARSEKNTRIYIPLTGESEVSQKEFIKFVTKRDSTKGIDKDSASNFRIRMFFNMDITPDAYTEIIFDKRSGDIIRGRGEGNIDLRYDSKGEMLMFGNYTIKEGWYNCMLANVISKEFVIDKGSRISWNGEPYEGTLDIKARYDQYVSLKPLFDTSFKSKPDLQRLYPTDVILGVRGNLSAPEITLDIDILRYPSDPQLSTVVTDFESKMKTNDQELNRQVFSLIMLKSFAPPNSFTGVSSGNNLSELLSNQLSHFLSQANQNLEVNLNLNNLDKDALNTLNLRLSYTTMAGRLRITRNGSFQNAQQTASQAYISNIAGEWTVEYMLSKDGNFRMKLFNRINNNALISTTGTTNTSAGLSLLHTQGFDSFRDIFGRRRRQLKKEEEERLLEEKKKREENAQPDKIPSPNEIPPSDTLIAP
jgi:hypothetical protein